MTTTTPSGEARPQVVPHAPGEMPVGAQTYSSAIADADNYTRWVCDLLRPHLGAPPGSGSGSGSGSGLSAGSGAGAGRRVLEVGIGHAKYRAHFGALDRYVGVDIDPVSVADAQRSDPTNRYVAADAELPDFAERVGERDFDAVVLINVLEHIEKHDLAVKHLASLLRPGGKLCIYVPAMPALYGEMDRLAGHWRRYTRRSLREVMSTATTVITCRYVNPIGALGWWLNRKRAITTLDDPNVNAQIRFFDRWVLPVSRLASPLTAPFFGQSVLGIGRRTGG